MPSPRSSSRPHTARPAGRRHRRLRILAAATAAIVMLPIGARAQEDCAFGEEGNDLLRRVTIGGDVVHYISNPHLVCADGVQLWADSAVTRASSSLSHLIGSVRYRDRTRELRADEARYFSNVGRLQAHGHLFLRDRAQGSTIEHGDLVYLRTTSYRREESMTVTTSADGVRPVATLQGGGEDEPYDVVADRIEMHGPRFEAAGAVRIERRALVALADSALYDRAGDRLTLLGSARVDNGTYELAARSIEMLSPGGARSEIRARRDATLTGDDLRLTSPQIFLFSRDGVAERLVAIPVRPDSGTTVTDSTLLARPVAISANFELTADSLEATAPGEVMERLFAAGDARSVSRSADTLQADGLSADSLPADSLAADALPEFAQADWLEGDTIVVMFARPGTADTLVSPPDSTARRPPAGGDAGSGDRPARTGDAASPSAAAAPGSTTVAGTPPPPSPGAAAAPGAAGVADSAPTAGAAAGGVQEARPGQEGPVVDRIVASVEARSLYRLPSADSVAGPPALHYVLGDEITIVMREGEVERMEVVGQTRGVHLEPLRTPAATTDSAAVRDTAAVEGAPTAGRGPPGTGAARLDAAAEEGAPPTRLALRRRVAHPGGDAPDGATNLPELPARRARGGNPVRSAAPRALIPTHPPLPKLQPPPGGQP